MRDSKILRPKTQWTPIVLNTIFRYQFDATPTAPHGADLDKLTQGSWSMHHLEASHIRLFLCGSHGDWIHEILSLVSQKQEVQHTNTDEITICLLKKIIPILIIKVDLSKNK